jgi:hypothetical protein
VLIHVLAETFLLYRLCKLINIYQKVTQNPEKPQRKNAKENFLKKKLWKIAKKLGLCKPVAV